MIRSILSGAGRKVRFGLLGDLLVEDDAGVAVPLHAPHGRALLATLLLAANRPVSRERLTGALWGDNPPPTAAAALTNQIARLRHFLGPDGAERLQTVPSGYLLRIGPAELDTEEFTRAVAAADAARRRADWHGVSHFAQVALGLWRGTPLGDLPLLTEEALPSVRSFEEARIQAAEWFFEAELSLGRHAGALVELTRWAALNPLHEVLHLHLVTALARNGRQAEALEVFEGIRGRLADELGVDPGPALRAVHQQVLRADPAVVRPPVPAAGAVDDRAVDDRAVDDRAVPADHEPGSGRRQRLLAELSALLAEFPAEESGPDAGRTLMDPESARPVETVRDLPGPAQLPLAPHGFVGRGKELAALTDLALSSAGETRTAVVTGPAGVGKTSLAVCWAQGAAADFPDGQLFADLRGYDRGEAESADRVLERFLLALGVPGDRIPAEPALREDLYRSTVAGRRLLIVLDNARDYEHVAPLLPGSARCFTMVTSRGTLGGLVARTGALSLRLGVLRVEESIQVLGRIAGEDRVAAVPEAAAELARLCGGLPLALRISAVRLVEDPDLPLAELAAELSPEAERLAGLGLLGDELTVERALEHTYRRLGADQARLFRLLSLHPGENVPLAAARALWGEDGPPADSASDCRRLLRSLESVHLIEQAGRGRYRMHDLVRLYGRQLANAAPAERAHALGRLFDWYIVTADASQRWLEQYRRRLPLDLRYGRPDAAEFQDAGAAHDWFTAESGNLLALTRLAVALGEHHVVWQLAVNQFTHHLRGRRFGVLEEVLRVGEDAATVLGHEQAAARCAANLGAVFSLRRDPRARDHFDRALTVHRRHGDAREIALASSQLGCLYDDLKRLDESVLFHRRAVEAARETGDRGLLGMTLGNLALVLVDQAGFADSRDALTEALGLAEEAGSEVDAVRHRRMLAWVLNHLGDHDGAFTLGEQTLILAERIEDPVAAGRMLDQMAVARAAQGRSEEARELWEQCLARFAAGGALWESDEVRARLHGHGM